MSTGSRGKGRPAPDALRDLGESLARSLMHPARLRDLDPLAETAARGAGLSGAILFANRPGGADPVVEAATGLESLRDRSVLLRAGRVLASWVSVGRETVVILDPPLDERIEAKGLEARALVVAPVIVFGEPVGALVGFWTDGAEPDPDRAVPVVGTVASVCGALLQLTFGADEIRVLRKRVKDLEAERARLEKLALTGETTVEVIAEIQRSTAAIAGFARRVMRGLPENDVNREYLDVTIGEIERLERLLDMQKRASALPESALGMEDVTPLIETVLNSRQALIVDRKARLLRRLSVGLPKLLLDRGRIRAALENILDHLLESVPRGGRLKVESKRVGDLVQIILAGDGPRRAGSTLDRLFVPFHPGGAETGQVGLAAACQIVREHGAEVGVRADPEWPALFVLNFPIKENEDRRRRSDRRAPRRDRRTRRDAA